MVSNDIIKRQEEISSRLDVIQSNDSQTDKEQDKPFNIDLQSNATLINEDSNDRGKDLKMQLQRAKYTNILSHDDEPDEDVIQKKKLPYVVSMRLTEELILYLNSKAKHPTKYIRQLIIDDMIRDKAWQDQRSRYGEIEQ